MNQERQCTIGLVLADPSPGSSPQYAYDLVDGRRRYHEGIAIAAVLKAISGSQNAT